MKTRQCHFVAMKNLIEVYHSRMGKVEGELFTKLHNIRTRQGLLKLLGREKHVRGSFCAVVCEYQNCCDRRLWKWTVSLGSKKALDNFPAN